MKKFTLLMISLAVSALVFAQAGRTYVEADENAIQSTVEVADQNNSPTPDAIWDIQFALAVDSITNGLGLAGCEWDGTYLYAAEWGWTDANSVLHKHIFRVTLAGALIDSFPASFTTGSGIRDMAFDGTYMYGSNAGNTIYGFTGTGTVVNTITSPVAARAIAYDDTNDGFWMNNWSTDITLVSRTGTILNVIMTPPSMYGCAWDGLSAGGPYLWIFTGTASTGCQVEQYKIATGTLTAVTHSVSGDFSPGTGLAGGLFTSSNIIAGEYTIGGIDQGSGTLFGYSLDVVVGQEELSVSNQVNIYPNPSTGTINVFSDNTIEQIDVISLSGQTVYSAVVKDVNIRLNLDNLNKGIYFIRTETSKGISVDKITLR